MLLKQSSLLKQLNHCRFYGTKTRGYEFYENILGSPKYIVGPMVEQSELAFRILCRRYNAHLCYTPMFHARLFSDPDHGHKYRMDQWSTNPEDRPLIVQFCANDPNILLRAAKMVEDQCDAVDLNLGCPQHIAKKGKYGSFLQDEWELIYKMISTLDRELKIPVTAKIRIFESKEKTVEYAKMLVSAGAQLITVHGRLREQKGHLTGLADWTKIRAVKEAVKDRVPVIANGNILYHNDLKDCLLQTGADGVMSAEGLLYNPMLFDDKRKIPPISYDVAIEYLDICKQLRPKIITRPGIIKAHLFKFFHTCLPIFTDLREQLAKSYTLEEMEIITLELKNRLIQQKIRVEEYLMNNNDILLCQPKIRK
ncbi:dihydrouridine synthase-domain-containing protein [Cokeromyces recurvatus]|uniref:dihydrouridine synthase-domain-containing protein n=1 Tax=Cokeromyces recurvatus TaxID=90255 RepID=UPI0022210A99|nr:dihydrouridine synthase-domain-containing protein [Cokeromyces recurvatus]KAI7901962.1 dihydrouridine synthase-domain-containing protein [Cokeromyces recurvatus]